MAQGSVGEAARGLTNRRALKPVVHRIVPAIPHALDRKRRPNHLHSTQVGEADSTSERPSISIREPTPVQDEDEVRKSRVADPSVAATPELVSGSQTMDTDEELDSSQHPMKLQDGADLLPFEKLGLSDARKALEDGTLLENHTEDLLSSAISVEHDPTSQDLASHDAPQYHTAHRSNPSSATSISIPQDPPSESESDTMHQPQLDASKLIFGGHHDSANTSPDPSTTRDPPPFARPPLAGNPVQVSIAASFHPTAQADPGSETQGLPMLLSPTFIPNSGGPGGHRDFYHQAAPQFRQPRPFPPPPPPHFAPTSRRPEDYAYPQRHPIPPARVDGCSQPMQDFTRVAPPYDQAGAIHPDAISGGRQLYDGTRQPDQGLGPSGQWADGERGVNQNIDRTFEFPPDDTAVVARYILAQFGNREFADYVVYVSHGRYLFPPATLAAHGVILARSPKLRSLMVMQHGGYQGQGYPKFLNVILSDRFLSHDLAFMKALMRLYGEPLPDKEFISKLSNPANQQGPETGEQEAMRFALTYAAAGHFLQMDEIIMHGLSVAASLLTWETVPNVLAFAMEGGLSSTFVQFEAATEDKGSNSSFDETPTKLESPVSTPTYGIYSDRMLQNVVGFLIRNCPLDFKLQETAPQLYEIARLPAVAEPNHSRSNSRFSQIRFGDMTIDEDSQPDFATITMSSIFLSLPYLLLKHVLESGVLGERLGWPKVAEIMRTVVQEREQRRQRAMKSRGTTVPYSGVEERLWRNVRWFESVDQAEHLPSGLKMSRHVVGVETPVSGSSNKSVVP